MRLVMSDIEFQEIELRAILREPVPVPPVVPEQVVLNEVIPKLQPVVDIPEAEDDIEPTVLALVAVLEMDSEDIDEDEEM